MATHRLAPVPLPRSRCALINLVLVCALVTLTVLATRATLTSVLEARVIPHVLYDLIGWQLYWIAALTVVEWIRPRALTVPNVVRAGICAVVGAVVPVIAALTMVQAVA